MTRKQKKTLRRIGIAAVLFFALFLIPERCILPGWLAWLPFAPGIVDSAGNPAFLMPGWFRLVLYLVPYLIVGWDVLWKAARNIRSGQVFDENFLMAVATLGALGCGGRGGYAVLSGGRIVPGNCSGPQP